MGTIKQLRWWAYKILPLAYDDSLSYYEAMDKTVNKVNELVNTVNDLPENVSAEIKKQLSGDGDVFDNLFNGLINAIAVKEGNSITFTPNNKQGGELIWLGDTLYEVVTEMQAGMNYIVGTNIVPVNIDSELEKIKTFISAHNEGYHIRATEQHNAQSYFIWKDGLYKAISDINVNDIIDGKVSLVNAMDEITAHYLEMHEADNNLQTQIDGNDGDIEELQKTDTGLQNQITNNNNTVNGRIDNIVAQANSDNTEIVDARRSAEKFGNINYGSLGTAIRTQIENSVNYLQSMQENEDANDLPVNSIKFVSRPATGLKNLPTDNAGVIACIGPTTARTQIFYDWQNNLCYFRIGQGTEANFTYHEWTQKTFYLTSFSDANSIKVNTFGFVSRPGNYSNLPNEEAGILVSYGASQGTQLQQFLDYHGNIYYRTSIGGTFTRWIKQVPTASLYYGNTDVDLNDILETSNYCITDAFHITNNPTGCVSLFLITLNYYDPTHISFQIAVGFDNNKIFVRTHIGSNWYAWHELGEGSGSSGNVYNNTYNITTAPTITTDTNGWLKAIDNEDTEERNATDMTGAIMSMLTDTGYCHLGEGTFYVSGNIELPTGSMIEGCGNKTIVRLLDSSDSYIFRVVNYSSIRNLQISGSKSYTVTGTSGNKYGIYFFDTGTDFSGPFEKTTKPCTINNVYINNFNNSGIFCKGTGGGVNMSLIVSDCYIENCETGINIDFFTEYSKFTNVLTFNCYTACINNGGNNVFVGCTFYATNTGFVIDNSKNDKINNGHGSCNGCTFNHIGDNRGDCIKIVGVVNGFIFDGSNIWYGVIHIENSQGIIFNGIEGGGTMGINLSNNKNILFANAGLNRNPTLSGGNNTGIRTSNLFNTSDGTEIDLSSLNS